MIPFQNSYTHLPGDFYQVVLPEKPINPRLIQFNQELAHELGIDLDLSNQEIVNIFSGWTVPQNTKSIALAYAGHQFGHLVPQLGDGRAVLLGEVVTKDNKRFDIQLKGSGKTPFSRRGDGKAPLGPVIREYIVSEAMFALGIPTTRALCALRTDETIIRQQAEPGGIFTRVASSHIRIGTFVYFAAKGDTQNLKILTDYTIDRHYPEVKKSAHPYLNFFKEVCRKQIDLVSSWMSVGFIHGVMNTDNTTISGETIDYGPCAFMDHFEFNKVYSSIDQNGRYAYNQQGSVIIWNLARLGECLIPLIDPDENKAIKELTSVLEKLPIKFQKLWHQKLLLKFGLNQDHPQASDLINLWFEYLTNEKLDFTNNFRNLSKLLKGDESDFKPTKIFIEFKNIFKNIHQNLDTKNAISTMNAHNPVYIPRNHLVQKAINSSINEDYDFFNEFNKVLSNPYNEQKNKEAFLRPPLDHEIVKATFCGT